MIGKVVQETAKIGDNNPPSFSAGGDLSNRGKCIIAISISKGECSTPKSSCNSIQIGIKQGRRCPSVILGIADGKFDARLGKEESLGGLDREDHGFLLGRDQIRENVSDRHHQQHGNHQKDDGNSFGICQKENPSQPPFAIGRGSYSPFDKGG